MSLIKWTIKIEHLFMKLWSNNLFLFQKQVSLPLSKLDAVSLPQQIQSVDVITLLKISMIMSIWQILSFPDLICSLSWKMISKKNMMMLSQLSLSILTWKTTRKLSMISKELRMKDLLKNKDKKNLKKSTRQSQAQLFLITEWLRMKKILFNKTYSRSIWFMPKNLWNQSWTKLTKIRSLNSMLISERSHQ